MQSTGWFRRALWQLSAVLAAGAAALCLPGFVLEARAGPRDGMTINFSPRDIWQPAPITDLTATPGSEGQVLLQWTAPEESAGMAPKPVPVVSYAIRAATFSVADLGGDTTAWFTLSSPVVTAPPPLVPGSPQALLTSLAPGVTFYFGIKSTDDAGLVSDTDSPLKSVNTQAKAAVKGIAGVTDLTAVPGGLSGSIALSWTHPRRVGQFDPTSYDVRASSTGQISNNADFDAAKPLSSLSPSSIPATGEPGGRAQVLITSLSPDATYYFAVRQKDSGSFIGVWVRNAAAGLNPDNSSRATLIMGPPDAITDLTALPTGVPNQVRLTWTAPRNQNLVAISSYRVNMSSLSVADLGGDATAWFNLAASTAFAVSPALPPGSLESLVINGVPDSKTFFFGVKSRDLAGSDSPIDSRAQAVVDQARITLDFIPSLPDAITDLAALPGAAEGEIALSWTAPRNQNLVPMSSYVVRFATFSAASLGGDTTAWFNAAAAGSVSKTPVLPAGRLETLLLRGLEPNTTFYFGAKSLDARGEVSILDLRAYGSQAFSRPLNLAPALPGGFTGIAGLRRAHLSWTDLTPAGRGLDFKQFQLYRSTQPAAGFVRVATATLPALTERRLAAFSTYYYRLSAVDMGANESVLSSTVAVMPFTLVPMEPMGVRVLPSSSAVTLTWAPTARFADGTVFESTSAPDAEELQGYSIRRATDMCQPVFTELSSAAVARSSFTDAHDGNPYYYQIKSFNRLGYSTATLVLSSLGEQNFFLDDCASRLVMSQSQADAMSAQTNGLGGDIQLARRRMPEETGGKVLQAVEFKAMLNGVTELKTFHLEKPARVILRFATAGGAPVPDASPLGVRASAPAGLSAQAAEAKNIGVYWNNNSEYKKLYGKVDPAAQTVTVETPNVGQFQLRSLFRADGPVFDLSNISARVITPNDDGLNDTLIFGYDPGPANVLPTGSIYDLRGAFVAPMTSGLVPNTLTWDGKSNGRAVTSGVYVYEIKGDGKTFNGTIVVAR